MTDSGIIDFKTKSKQVKEGQKQEGPQEENKIPPPSIYDFYLKTGKVRRVVGYLAASTTQVLVVNEDEMMVYLVPLDVVEEIIKADDE